MIDKLTDRRTDRPSYRDVRAHLNKFGRQTIDASSSRVHTHTHKHAHKRAAGINEIAEPDASAAVYPALFL